jgi:AcrR family transcriptional regulator
VNSAGATSPGTAGAGTRARVLAAALRCFLDGGYEQSTIAQIRIRSGVSNGALFHHFPTKDAIADALYVEGIASFQQGLWQIVRRPPRSLLAAVRAVIGHQLTWTEQHPDHARFIYQRGHLDFDSPGGAAVHALNRDLAAVTRQWMAPLTERGLVRPSSMLLVTAIVSGPAHAIARRWLAGQLDAPLSAYTDELARAACAALSPAGPGGTAGAGTADAGTADAGRADARTAASAGRAGDRAGGRPDPGAGRVTIELLDPAGAVSARGEATIRLAPR